MSPEGARGSGTSELAAAAKLHRCFPMSAGQEADRQTHTTWKEREGEKEREGKSVLDCAGLFHNALMYRNVRPFEVLSHQSFFSGSLVNLILSSTVSGYASCACAFYLSRFLSLSPSFYRPLFLLFSLCHALSLSVCLSKPPHPFINSRAAIILVHFSILDV